MTEYLRLLNDRYRVGSQRGRIEREIARTILHKHTIYYVEGIIVETCFHCLSTPFDVLFVNRAVLMAVLLILCLDPTIVETVRCYKGRVDLTALHILQFTIRAAKREVRITEVTTLGTVKRSQTRCKVLSLIIGFTEVNTYGGPLFPYHVRTGLCNRRRRQMPSLLDRCLRQKTILHHIRGVKVRLTALTDRITVD